MWKYINTLNVFCRKKRHMIYLYPISTCQLPRHANWQIGEDGYAEEDLSAVDLAMRLADAPAQKITYEEFLK
jgi:hypothetical protein